MRPGAFISQVKTIDILFALVTAQVKDGASNRFPSLVDPCELIFREIFVEVSVNEVAGTCDP